MDREWMTTSNGKLALTAMALAIALTLWVTVRAVQLEALPDGNTLVVGSAESLAIAPPSAPLGIDGAVENDLFSADRSAPDSPYRLPGEGDAARADAPAEPIVLGTAYFGGESSFATCQLADGKPVILRQGDKIGTYSVKSIERGHVVFTTTAGRRLDIPALKPES